MGTTSGAYAELPAPGKEPVRQEQSRNPCTLCTKSVKLCQQNTGVVQCINNRPPTAQNIQHSQAGQ
jgi:hypothetical protein